MVGARMPGVFCLEESWGKRLDDRTSVLPTLESLERLRSATYIHRDVGTEEELYHYLGKWAQAGYRKHGVLFFAFLHGVKGWPSPNSQSSHRTRGASCAPEGGATGAVRARCYVRRAAPVSCRFIGGRLPTTCSRQVAHRWQPRPRCTEEPAVADAGAGDYPRRYRMRVGSVRCPA